MKPRRDSSGGREVFSGQTRVTRHPRSLLIVYLRVRQLSETPLPRACFLRAGGRTAGEQLISHQWETLHNEPRSFQAKPQENTRIYSGVNQRQITLSILVQFLISLNDSLMLLLMIPFVAFSKKEQKTTTFWEVVEFDKVDGWMELDGWMDGWMEQDR